jgi:hypothetical protein
VSRTQRIAAAAAVVAVATLGATGVAEASDHSHHHSHDGHHGHGRVGDNVYSSHHSDRYGQDYGIISGLLWSVTHTIL